MTSKPEPQFQDAPTTEPQTQDSPRKRRKRAPAAGAAADCFTCSNLNLECDRRRPYCSQCLEGGRDCSGYKTQLTWGVGVASRGKLRGLSLPVAGTQRLASSLPTPKPKKKSSVADRKPKPRGLFIDPFAGSKLESTSPSTARSITSVGHLQHGHTSASERVPSATNWQTSPKIETSSSTTPINVKIEHSVASPSSYQTTFSAKRQISPTKITPSARKCSTIKQQSPRQLDMSANQIPYLDRNLQQTNVISPNPPLQNGISGTFWSTDENSSPNEATSAGQVHNEQYSYNSNGVSYQYRQEVNGHDAVNGHSDHNVVEEIGHGNAQDEYAVSDELSSFSIGLNPVNYSLSLSPFAGVTAVGKTPRMQYLINYYAEVISPVIVAFDGPSNPYRTQILRLAAESETLQHAISALSASNLRQRGVTGWISTGKTDPARRSSMAHLTLTDETWHQSNRLSIQDQVREEAFHRGVAISALNAQLADPARRKNDSTLAILLILCLFHICDSGVAKFQTQFAGVKKLLNMRGEDLAFNTKETKWFTRMFTWFDAMTATVNNREGLLQGYYLDISALSDEEWTLENLAGCDGKLFKIIAKLGRLNVLSQGKSAESNPTLVCRPMPVMQNGYGDFDGNGWARLIADEDLFSQKTTDLDPQTQFWREWREIRQALQMWQLDTSMFDAASPEAPLLTQEQRVDLANISECFRYSSLLYTERLASPATPSSDPNIQGWVQESLRYIKEVKSDVYLLWPLFITGSECMSEEDRGVIRERCLDIQKDSGFFNNQSCLELLEKVWMVNPVKGLGPGGGGFKFSHVMKMEGNEGEYIVV